MPDVRLPNGQIARFPDGMPAAQIEAVLQRQFPHPAPAPAPASTFAGASASGAAHQVPVTQDVAGFMAQVNRGSGVGDEMAAGMDTALNVATGRVAPSSVVQGFRQSMGRQRALENDFQARHPNLAALGRGVGMGATVLVPGVPAVDAIQAGRAVSAARGAVAGGLTAGGYAAADAGTPQERLAAASRAVRDPTVLALGAAGGAMVGRGTARAPRPVNPDVAALNAEGVPLTYGQMAGGAARHIEDAATSTPILGPAISAARRRGVEAYSNATVNPALAPLGERLPPNIAPGHDAVAYSGDRLSAGYADLRPAGPLMPDQHFASDLQTNVTPIIQDMTPARQEQLRGILEQRLASRASPDGSLTPENFQRVVSELRTVSRRFSGSTDGDQRALAEAIDGHVAALENMAARQDPAYAERLQALDQGYAHQVRAENAAASAGAQEGVATPAQYNQAVRQGDARTRRRGFARGEALGQDLARSGRAVLPSTLNDSGTATRGTVGMVIGGVAGGVANIPGVLTAAGTLALARQAYGPEAIAAANAALSRRIADQPRREALAQLQNLSRRHPELQRLYARVVARAAGSIGYSASASNAPRAPAISN